MVKSHARLYQAARQVIPSGVNSPVRAFGGVGGTPVFMKRGKGAYVWDEQGRKYLDYCCSWGPLLLGHAPAGLVQVLRRAAANGTSFGTATAGEVELARMICDFVPSVEKVRLVSSGTEAVMSAVRLARGVTGRELIVKIDGGYHGHVDSLLIQAGSGGATFGIPDSAGIPAGLARLTVSIPFNDIKALERVFHRQGKKIAAMILEPVPANMGVVTPVGEYLHRVRELTRKNGALLIFDEVMTGFRVSRGGVQEYFGVTPDLTTMGKVVGGGLPLAAFGGRRQIMDHLAPGGTVYQAGTLSGNPLAVAGALWMLSRLKNRSLYEQLNRKAAAFYEKFREMLRLDGHPCYLNVIGSMFTLFFSEEPVTDYASAKRSDTKRFARFFHGCLKEGLYLAPSQFEANFIGTVHSQKDLEKTLRIFRRVLAKV